LLHKLYKKRPGLPYPSLALRLIVFTLQGEVRKVRERRKGEGRKGKEGRTQPGLTLK